MVKGRGPMVLVFAIESFIVGSFDSHEPLHVLDEHLHRSSAQTRNPTPSILDRLIPLTLIELPETERN